MKPKNIDSAIHALDHAISTLRIIQAKRTRKDISAYTDAVAGTADDLDRDLEAAGVEHLQEIEAADVLMDAGQARANKILLLAIRQVKNPQAKAWLNDGRAAKTWLRTAADLLERSTERAAELGLSEDEVNEAVAVELAYMALSTILHDAKKGKGLLTKASTEGADIGLPLAEAEVKAAGWYRPTKPRLTPVERSEAAQRAVAKKKLKQIPVVVKVGSSIQIPAYMENDASGKLREGSIYFRNYKSLVKLAGLPMTGRHYDDMSGETEGETVLGKVLRPGRLTYLEFRPPYRGKEGDKGGWYMHVIAHSNESYTSVEPLTIQIQKTQVPEPVDFGEEPMAVDPESYDRD